MARKPRVHFPGALYHVIVRGNKRQRVFRREEDFKLYLRLLGEYKEVFDFVLCAYALMPTHVHLLVEVRDKPLSGLMQRLQFRYTRNYNIRYKTWGHLFQGRYKAILCEKDSYLVELSAYIHLNPVRAGLVRHPQEYRWTSYGSYLNGGRMGIVDVEPVLGQFSARKGKAVRAYGQYVLDHIGDGYREEFYKVEDQRFLGSEGFADRIHRGAKEKVEHIYEISLEDLVDGVEMGFGIPVRVIRGMNRNRRAPLASRRFSSVYAAECPWRAVVQRGLIYGTTVATGCAGQRRRAQVVFRPRPGSSVLAILVRRTSGRSRCFRTAGKSRRW